MFEVKAQTGSTNADLAAKLRAGEPVAEGDWIIADQQSAGRGRLGRVWQDGAGQGLNFLGSCAIRLGVDDPFAGSLALVAGLAVWDAVDPLVPPPLRLQLKWPNDLLVGDAKLAGLLLERVGGWVVIGIGVNLAFAPDLPDRACVALSRFGPAPDRDLFARNLAQHLARRLAQWRGIAPSGGLAGILADWQRHSQPKGHPMSVTAADGLRMQGEYLGLGPDGALLLGQADGTTATIYAGDVDLV